MNGGPDSAAAAAAGVDDVAGRVCPPRLEPPQPQQPNYPGDTRGQSTWLCPHSTQSRGTVEFDSTREVEQNDRY